MAFATMAGDTAVEGKPMAALAWSRWRRALLAAFIGAATVLVVLLAYARWEITVKDTELQESNRQEERRREEAGHTLEDFNRRFEQVLKDRQREEEARKSALERGP